MWFIPALVLLALLWIPAGIMAIRGTFRGGQPSTGLLKWLWPAQLLLAASLIFLADRLGLGNPAGYSLAITFFISGAGALTIWRANTPSNVHN